MCCFGTSLEFYNFIIFGLVSVQLSEYFFNRSSNEYHLIFSLLTFSVAFLVRPLGAFLFGYIGDRFGRKNAIVCSVTLMSLSTFFIGIVPSYETIGILSTIMLFIFRIGQGLSMGGEFTSTALYIFENHLKIRKGLFSGMLLSSVSFGFILALVLNNLFQNIFGENGWRFLFFSGFFLGFLGLLMRMKLPNIPVNENEVKNPLLYSLKKFLPQHILFFSVTALSGINAYSLAILTKIIIQKYAGIDDPQIVNLMFLTHVVFSFMCFFMGAASDFFGKKNIIALSQICFFIFLVPIYKGLLSGDLFLTSISLCSFAVLIAMHNAPLLAFSYQLFPVEVRCSAISVNYAIAMAIFGGSMPALSIYLMENFSYLMPAKYHMMISFIVYLTMRIFLKKIKI